MTSRSVVFALLLLASVPTPGCSQCTTCQQPQQQPTQVLYNSQVAYQPNNNQGRPAGYVNIQFQPPSSVSRNQQIYVWYGNPQPNQNQLNQALGANGQQPQYNVNNNNGYIPNNQQPVMYNNLNRDQPTYGNQPYNPNVQPQQQPLRPNPAGFVPPSVPSTAFPYSTTTPGYNTVGPLAPIQQSFDPSPIYATQAPFGSTQPPLNYSPSPSTPFYNPSTTPAPPLMASSTTSFPYSTTSPQYSPSPYTSTAAPFPSSTSTMMPSTTTSAPFYPSTTTAQPFTQQQPQLSSSTVLPQQGQGQPYVLGSSLPPTSTAAPFTSTTSQQQPLQIGYNPAGQQPFPSTSTQAPFPSTTTQQPFAQSTTPYGSPYPITGTPVNAGGIGVNPATGSPTPYYPPTSTMSSQQQPFYGNNQPQPNQFGGQPITQQQPLQNQFGSTTPFPPQGQNQFGAPLTQQQPFNQNGQQFGSTTASPVYQIGQGGPGSTPLYNAPNGSPTSSPYAVGGSTLGNQVLFDPSTGLVTANGINTMYGRYTTMEPGSQVMRDTPVTNSGAALSLIAGVAALIRLL